MRPNSPAIPVVFPHLFWAPMQSNTFSFEGDIDAVTTIESNFRLAVNGDNNTEEVKVDLSVPAPDYVFKENYDLPTLEEVEEHIQGKGHLINIPTAEEVKAKGIEVGEMNKLLLKKIEELTLYMIELKKETNKQQRELEMLKKGILKNRISKSKIP